MAAKTSENVSLVCHVFWLPQWWLVQTAKLIQKPVQCGQSIKFNDCFWVVSQLAACQKGHLACKNMLWLLSKVPLL